MSLKLNLGSGQKRKPGYLNVDKHGTPDFICNLESFPWPWPDDSVSEILLHHVLEHLGATPDVFIGIMKQMYRVCAHGARIHIVVPHPRHDFFIGDPTHVRPITPDMFHLFSKRNNRAFQEMGAANTPLALYHDVDFNVTDTTYVLDEPYASELQSGKLREEEVGPLIRKFNNVAVEIRIELEVVKS